MRKEDVNSWCFVTFLIGSFCAITWFFVFLSKWGNYSIKFKIIGLLIPITWILLSYGILTNNRLSALITLNAWFVWAIIVNFKMGKVIGLFFTIPAILLHLKVFIVIYSNTDILRLNRSENKFKQLFGKKQLVCQNKFFYAWILLYLLFGFLIELFSSLTIAKIYLRPFILIYAILIITFLLQNRLFKLFMDILFVGFIFNFIFSLGLLGANKIQIDYFIEFFIGLCLMLITYAGSIKYIKFLHNNKNAPEKVS